jgi:hypothetical protein
MSLSDDFNINAHKDAYDYSCLLARLDEYRHVMTYSPSASGAGQEELVDDLVDDNIGVCLPCHDGIAR